MLRKTLISLLIVISGILAFGHNTEAYFDVTNATLNIEPNIKEEVATWTTSFTIPEDMELGHMVGTISGNPLDLSNTTATVSGLPSGGEVIIKPRTTCASGCDDFRFYYQNPVPVSAGTRVTITLRNVGNPRTSQTGWGYLNLYDVAYPVQHLGAKLSNKKVPLVDAAAPTPEPEPEPVVTSTPAPNISFSADRNNLSYDSATTLRWQASNASSCSASGSWSGSRSTKGSEATGNLKGSRTYTLTCSGQGGTASESVVVNVAPPVVDTSDHSTGKGSTPAPASSDPQPVIIYQETNISITSITQIILANFFFFEGSDTTDLSAIEDPSSVEDFTLDIADTVEFRWTEEIDLSTEVALSALDSVDEYIEYGWWYFYMEWEFWAIWEVPVEVTFYDCQCVAEPAILKDGEVVEAEDLELVKEEDKTDVKFEIDDGGKYTMQHAIHLDGGDKIKTKSEEVKISGTVSDPAAKLELTVNGEVVEEEIDVDPETGRFEQVVKLILGNNQIAMAAEGGDAEILPASQNIDFSERGIPWIYTIAVVLVLGAAIFIGRGMVRS